MLALIGCGFLGSIFATEAAKRLWAHDMFPLWRLIDGDTFEARNAANQNCYPSDDGKPKAWIVSQELVDYQQRLDLVEIGKDLKVLGWVHDRVTEANIDQLLDGATLLIDAVDNVATRQLLWMYGVRHKIPVLHMGVSRRGTGTVEWTLGDYDTFGLSPLALAGQPLPADPVGELKPCELLTHRRTGLLVGHTAALALTAFLGLDPERQFNGEAVLSTWRVGPDGVTLREARELDSFDLDTEE